MNTFFFFGDKDLFFKFMEYLVLDLTTVDTWTKWLNLYHKGREPPTLEAIALTNNPTSGSLEYYLVSV